MPEIQCWTIRMSSGEHGEEEFHYDSLEEARRGWERLRMNIHKQNDGITRCLTLIVDEEEITSGDAEEESA